MHSYMRSAKATSISRRAFTAGIVAAAASPQVIVRAHAQITTGTHKLGIGEAEVTVITDGTMLAPLDWILPGRPRAEIDAVLSADGRTLGDITLQVNATLIRLGRDLILIDTGGGPDFAPQRGRLADNLAKAAVKPEDITLVVFTHAHPDHFWGVFDPLDGGTMFPNARHLMTSVERDYWLKPGVETTVPEAVRGSAIGTQRRLKELGGRIETMKPETEIVPGLFVTDTSGHSPGHASLILRSSGEQVMIGGDVLIEPTVSFARPAWTWGPDWDADRAVKTRLATLDRLASEKMRLLGYHLPWPGLGRVEKREGAAASYRFVTG